MPVIGSDKYTKGILIKSFQGLILYRGRKFFFQDGLLDWSVLETYSLRQIEWMFITNSLRLARPIPPEVQRLNHARKIQASEHS